MPICTIHTDTHTHIHTYTSFVHCLSIIRFYIYYCKYMEHYAAADADAVTAATPSKGCIHMNQPIYIL